MQNCIEKGTPLDGLGTLFGVNFASKFVYIPNVFRHRFLTYVLHVFLICSNRWNLKKHCISAVKHVFQQGWPFTNNPEEITDFTYFGTQVSTFLASQFIIFSVRNFALIFDAILIELWVENEFKMDPKINQNQSKNASEKTSRKGG